MPAQPKGPCMACEASTETPLPRSTNTHVDFLGGSLTHPGWLSEGIAEAQRHFPGVDSLEEILLVELVGGVEPKVHLPQWIAHPQHHVALAVEDAVAN